MPTNGMTIDSLNTVSSLTAQDEVPVWDKEASGEHTRKITAQNMANSVKSLASLPNTTEMNNAIAQSTADVIRTGDVVNSLTSTETDKPLSAAQGKALNDKLYQTFGHLVTDGITFSNCSLIYGGYCKIGCIVIVEIRVKITNAVAKWGTILTGMPYAGYANEGYYEVPLTANKYNSPQGAIVVDISNTSIRCVSDTTLSVDDEISISGVYLTN